MERKHKRSENFKSFQTNIKRKNTFKLSKQRILELRDELMSMMIIYLPPAIYYNYR
ncbi:hypothetical protein CDLVIII_2961 [Clostridium sp. DL-VIII]|uniref:hypothetical protein n=1 Tax=Clostridium sp. DL-VIII TaxID=641107 RepID=UPI00023AFCD0|nr:hypothetical protein [Clostridium sp. DL-VIII]EHI99551.1 hypothetical protein CDLVIII_2961 [Clostridium sp. DL-VIII]